MDTINRVLDFNKTAIISILMKKDYSIEMLRKVRNACKIITEAGLYQLDRDCTESELLVQIEDFIQEGMKEND